MKHRIKRLLNNFARWLEQKTHVITATEIMFTQEAKKAAYRRCEHCHEYAIHFLDDCSCKI